MEGSAGMVVLPKADQGELTIGSTGGIFSPQGIMVRSPSVREGCSDSASGAGMM